MSNWGAHDMVGNVWEWVGDWSERPTACTDWTTAAGIPGDDASCVGGDGSAVLDNVPTALMRGGFWFHGTAAGDFAVTSIQVPHQTNRGIGFRCAR